jgi:hypothetical protein
MPNSANGRGILDELEKGTSAIPIPQYNRESYSLKLIHL